MKAIFTGSFDPLTKGHLDLIERTISLFSNITICVSNNTSKKYFFSLEKRVEHIKHETSHLQNVDVIGFDGLVVDLAMKHIDDNPVIIRGLRNASDFDYENMMLQNNKAMTYEVVGKKIETIFLPCSNEFSFVSSSRVKEIIKYDGNINYMVTPYIKEKIDLKRNIK